MLITEILTDRDKLMIVAEFTHTTPGALFNYWIVPELLQKWWPPEAEVEPRLGGAYHLFWRQITGTFMGIIQNSFQQQHWPSPGNGITILSSKMFLLLLSHSR